VGAATEGPVSSATSGTVGDMILCPAKGVDTFKKFNGNSGTFNRIRGCSLPRQCAVLQHHGAGNRPNHTSFLMWSWRLAKQPHF
jgi:endoglucanase